MRQQFISKSLVCVSLAGMVLTIGACGKKKSSSGGGTTNTETINNALALAIPGTLAVASPTASKSATLLTDDPVDFSSRKDANVERLNCADAATCVKTFALPTDRNNPTCYGPNLDYQNHPNGSPTSGQLPSGDLGLWSAAESTGEACVAAKMNTEVENVAAYATLAMDMTSMVFGAANLAGKSLPAVGATEDFKSAVTDKMTGQNIGGTIDTATVTRNDDSGGRPKYTTTLKITPATAGTVTSMTVVLTHIALDDTNATYKGRMKVYLAETGAKKAKGISLHYNRASSTSLKYAVRSRESSDSAITIDTLFDSTGDVIYPTGSANDGYKWGIFDLDPQTGLGKVAYLWVAGFPTENTRSFYAETSASGTDIVGKGYFGFGDALSNITTSNYQTKWLDRMICNWAGPSNNHTGVAKAQKQEIKQTGGLGTFASTSSAITYAPANSCVGDGSFAGKLTTATSYTTFGTTSDLVTLSAESFTIPAAPDAI